MKTTVHRIEEIREHYSLTPKELERKLGMSNGSWEKALGRNSSIKDDIIRKALDEFPGISLRWLVLGEGEMMGVDPLDPNELAKYISRHHEELVEQSELYKEKMLNIGMEEVFKKYGHLSSK